MRIWEWLPLWKSFHFIDDFLIDSASNMVKHWAYTLLIQRISVIRTVGNVS
jgi:hypothetical protein